MEVYFFKLIYLEFKKSLDAFLAPEPEDKKDGSKNENA